MPYVFGPVPSRRLGMSLGIDLIPPKTCSFDCLYCQVGRTTFKTIEPAPFSPVEDVLSEVESKLAHSEPDVITLAGSGEPTLHSEIHRVISGIKSVTDTKVVLLTNGACFWRDEIRNRVLEADIIMPTLSSAIEPTFNMIHRPHPDIKLGSVLRGLRKLRISYSGLLLLEVVLLAGINDTHSELERLKGEIDEIAPDRIQLNTVVRPPADKRAQSLDADRMEEIKNFFGDIAEIVSETKINRSAVKESRVLEELINIVKRRPLRSIDISKAMGLPLIDVEDLIKGLVIKGYLVKREHSGEDYYLNNE